MSNLFRKKSLERISSPEQLNAYIRVSTPSVWLVLCAVTVLLAGVCVWGVFGRLETTVTAVCLADKGRVTAFVKEADAENITLPLRVRVDGVQGLALGFDTQPMRVDESFTDYMLRLGGLTQGEWVYLVLLEADVPDGVHQAQIVLDSVPPMSFVLN